MVGPDLVPTTDRMRAIDKLRRQQRIFRVDSARLLKAANELLEAPSPSSNDLQEAIDQLESKYTALHEVDQKIIDLLESHEVEIDYFEALTYQGKICHAINRLRSALKSPKAVGLRRKTDITFAHQGDPPQRGSRTSTSAVVLPKLQVSAFDSAQRGPTRIEDHVEATADSPPNIPDIGNVSTAKRVELSLPVRQTDVLTFTSLTRIEQDKGGCDHFALTMASAISTPDSGRPETSLANFGCMAVQESVLYNAEKGCLPQTGCIHQTEQDQAFFKVASSVPTQDGFEESEATPAADTDDWAASTQAGDEKREGKDVKESIASPPYTFEYILVPDFMNEKALPLQLPEIRPSPIVKLERDAAPRFKSVSFCLPEVRKTEPLLVTISGNCNETPKPC